MSRIRIVKGNITKITGGTYKIFAKDNIEFHSNRQVIQNGKDGIKYGEPEEPPQQIATDFDIKVELLKEEKTFVPLGIPDFEGKAENSKIKFKITVSGKGVEHWQLDINSFEETIYTVYSNSRELDGVTVTAKGKKENISTPDNSASTATPEYKRFWPAGEYVVEWDGFDKNDIYMNKRLLDGNLKAIITGSANGCEKDNETDTLKFEIAEADWVDVLINKSNKTIQVMLRVNLTDGGAEGFGKEQYQDPSKDPLFPSFKERDEWDKIPPDIIARYGYPPIKQRTKSYEDLVKLALDGLAYHWGRNKNHAVAKYVTINDEQYEVYILPENTTENSMKYVNLVYNTNNDWMRSGNPGSATWNPISWIGNAVSREAVCYNVGYIYEYFYKNTWSYVESTHEDPEFKFTSAHEIGHSILKAYGGTIYSYGHKGSSEVYSFNQHIKDDAPTYPTDGEIDIMPYYPKNPPLSSYNRYVASEKDVLGLIWLAKIKLK